MPLSPATRLGPYEIISAIGAGGMGEVYRAKDLRLNREIAIKVLPATFSNDSERLRRFEQEAQAAGALNHPNILAVYDVGTHDGMFYIVSELLQGETLRRRLAESPVPTRKAIDYAIQIARGLAAAHAKGILHRDLKPENLFVTKDGQIKILDFGLAKIITTNAGAAATSAPTEAIGTQSGVVMGTVGYMSPEQVRGQVADSRSDIFSLGVILYEMLSGKRAFHGESSVETMNAILKGDPPELPASLPAALDRLIRRAIEKKPDERFQSAWDLAFTLESISTDSGREKSVSLPAAPARVVRRLAVTVVMVTLSVAAWVLVKRASRSEVPQFQQVTFRRGLISGARFASDGKTIIYSAAWDGNAPELFSTLESSPESRPLGIVNAHVAAISRTGEMALILSPQPGFFAAPITGTLARAPVSGGAPRELAENVVFADWAPDGTQLAVVRAVPGGQVLEYPLGKKLYETAGVIFTPKISPKGDLVAFLDAPLTLDPGGRIAIVDASGNKRMLSRRFLSLFGLAWSSDGSEIWFCGADFGLATSLEAVDLNGSERVAMHLPGPGYFVLMDTAPGGRALVMHDTTATSMYFHPTGGRQETDLYWHDNSIVRDLSPDSSQILFSEGGAASTTDWVTYMRSTNGSPAVRLGEGLAAAFSPDGNWAMTNPTGPQAPLIAFPTHAGNAQPLASDTIRHVGGRWLGDGKRIVFVGAEPGHRLRYYVQDSSTSAPRAISGENIAFDRGDNIVISPDGRSVAAIVADQGIQLLPVDGGLARPVSGVTAGFTPVTWCRDWGLLIYRPGEIPAHVVRVDPKSGRQQLWKEIAPRDRTALSIVAPIRVASDCEAFAYNALYDPSTLMVARGLH